MGIYFARSVLGGMSVEYRWVMLELSRSDTTLRLEPFP